MVTGLREWRTISTATAAICLTGGLLTVAPPPPGAQAVGSSAITCKGSTRDAQLARVRYETPDDAKVSKTIGDVSITTTTPVTMTEAENSTNLFFDVANSSTTPVTIEVVDWAELLASRPSWIMHMSHAEPQIVAGSGSGSSLTAEVPAGATKRLEFYVSKDSQGTARATGTLNFRFRVQGRPEIVAMPVDLIALDHWGADASRLPPSAALTGRVVDSKGAPVRNALVSVGLATGQLARRVRTDHAGRYRVPVLSDAGLRQFLGQRELPYASLSWFMTVDTPGASLAYRQGITLGKGQVLTCNVRLQPVRSLDYRLSSTTATDGKYGFWEMRLFGAGDRIVAIKGVHPPAQNSTAYVLALDLNGKELWRVPTGEECWGLDVSAQGDRIAVACFDGIVRVLDANGATLASLRTTPGMAGDFTRGPQTSVFSPDGRSMVVETEQGTSVLDTTTWQPRWTAREKPYQAVWSADGGRLVMGAGELVMSYTSDGQLQWQRPLGNVALYLSMDSAGRTYAAGKSRELFVYEPDGSLAWSFRAAHTVDRTFPNAGISRDGSLVVLPTFNGLDQALDRAGRVRWQRFLPLAPQITPQGQSVQAVYGPGHNSTYVSPDGSYILQGTRAGQVVRYDSRGSLLWQSEPFPARTGWIDDGHYFGANSIVATPDGRVIVAGFMDSTIRIFRLR